MSVILQAAIPTPGPPSYSRRQTSHRVSLPPGSPITQRSLSPSSPPGENTVSNLNEQRRRSSGVNRKRRALTLDMTATVCTFQAQALSKVQDYKGQCVLEVSQSSISVKVAPCLDSTTENRDLGTWPFDCIRRFNTQFGGVFVFTSGRRGPGGVRDYQFKMSDEDLLSIQQLLNQRTGAVFDSPNRSSRASSTSSISSVPTSSTRTESVSSIDDRPPIPTPTSTDSPSSSPHTRRNREYTPTPPPPSPSARSASPRTSAVTIHRMPSPVSPGIARAHSSSHLQDYKSPSPLLQGKTGPGFKDDHTNPTYQHQFPLHPASGEATNSASDKQFHTLPPVLAARQQQHHHYEEAKDVVAPKKNRKEKGKKSKKSSQIVEKTGEGYDKLADVRPHLSSVPEERDRPHSDEFNSTSPNAVSVLPRSTTDPLTHVELRHKPQSPPPVFDSDTSSLDIGMRNWTKKEIKQVKKLQRETLINSSPVTHERRGAQYTEITLPNDSGSTSRDSTSSESSSLYAVPSSIPATTEFIDGNSTYDIPSSANPSGLSVPHARLAHTPSPTNSRSPSPSNLPASTDMTYDVPRSSPSQKKKTPPHKPLPHLPDDYVNVTLQHTTTQLPKDDQEYMNVNGNEQVDDVYSEIPAHLSKPSLPSDPRPPVDAAQLRIDSGLYSNIPETSAEQFEEELARKSETLARELASSGYEYVKPAKTPPVMSPKRTTPPAESNPLTDEYIVMQGGVIASASPTPVTPPATTVTATLDDDNEYIIVNKSKPAEAAAPGESYVNTPPRTRRGNNGYDEVHSSTILANQSLVARPTSASKSHGYENASAILANKEGSSLPMTAEPTDEYVNIPESKQRRTRDGYEEVNPAALRYSPPKSNAQVTSNALPPSGVQRLHIADDADTATLAKQLDKQQASADIGDMVEADVLEESFVRTNGDEDEYMVMRPQRQLSSSSTEDTSSSPPVRANGHKPIPIKASAENRKRSLTVGNTPDSVPKKHPYENIKEQIFIPQSPPLIDSALSKKPMPLPRPTGVVLKHPKRSSSNSEEPVVQKLVRAFSKPVFSQSTENGAVRRTNSQ